MTAQKKLEAQNKVLVFCRRDGVTGRGTATVTFAPSGRVTGVVLDPPYAGTAEGSCVIRKFQSVRVPPYTGGPAHLKHAFSIPKPR